MPDASTNNKNRPQDDRSTRGVKLIVTLLSLILLPAGLYALYVVGQLADIRRHDLRGLESTARAAESLLGNARTTVRNLIGTDVDLGYACTFFRRQTRLRLATPRSCDDLDDPFYATARETLHLAVSNGTLAILGDCDGRPCLRIEVVLGALLEQIPFGEAFDQLLVADDKGRVIGSAVSPQRGSPMLPPRVPAVSAPPPLRVFTTELTSPAAAAREGAPDGPELATLAIATQVSTVDVGGRSYTLMCQPWRVELEVGGDSTQTWRVCGLKDSQASFQRALEVAPNVVIVLLAFLTFAIVSWPILKILSLAPEERVSFADMYLTLFATLGLVMLLAAGIADVGAFATSHAHSKERLAQLAREIEGHLRDELLEMRDQLVSYDGIVNDWLAARLAARLSPLTSTVRVGCLLRPATERTPPECETPGTDSSPPPALAPPREYPALESVYWMRPCDGWQVLKATTRFRNTPAVRLDTREYFRAIKRGQPWRIDDGREVFVETAASITTGEFFTALSIESVFEGDGAAVSTEAPPPATLVSDCVDRESQRFAAALSGQPVSMRYPVLAPGVGFAVTDPSGAVLFHSDERRAATENLFADDGLATPLREALAARGDAYFETTYQTRPHDVYVHPVAGLPWTVVTFVDGEVLRTFHVEVLGRTVVLIVFYLLLALVGTLLYMAVHGREPPVWMWPRHGAEYRPIYRASVACLAVQLAAFLAALDYLQGIALVLVCLALPLTAFATVHAAAEAAKKVATMVAAAAAGEAANDQDQARSRVYASLAARCRGIGGATLALAAGAGVAMAALDTLSSSRASPGIGTVVALVVALALAVATYAPRVLRRLDRYDWWRRGRDDPLTLHIAGTALVWLLAGALPAYGLFELALGRETIVATKAEQAYLARAYAWQACRKQEDLRFVATADAAPAGAPERDVYVTARLAPRAAAPGERARLEDDAQTWAAQFWRPFANLAPVYNESTIYKRFLDPLDEKTGSPWAWSFSDRAEPALVHTGSSVAACGAAAPVIASNLPSSEPELGWLRAAGVVGFLVLLVAWVAFGARKLFFGDIEPAVCKTGRSLDAHLGGLGARPNDDWVRAEIEPLDGKPALGETLRFSEATVDRWTRDESMTRRAVVDEILDRVRPLYETWWRQCTADEKLVLAQLVEEGFANPKQGEVVRSLLRKGRLRRDPILRPVNHSFAVFVEAVVEPADLERETPHRGLRLTGIRGVLLAALVLVLVFLSITQQDTVQIWLAYLTTAAASAVGVLKLMSFVSRPSIKAD